MGKMLFYSCFWRLENGDWRLEGYWRLENGDWRFRRLDEVGDQTFYLLSSNFQLPIVCISISYKILVRGTP
ncbi:MAG TPA: hypothetical protein DCK87_06155 [Desulfotomaculum sp.]|nr:hypothetical protein [Desulfotomaculum sp.]